MKPSNLNHVSGHRRGFALVVTLSLMILLTIIAVGLLSLSSISLRASSAEQLNREARQNARMALMLAIGELQSATGPDQRVTAPAGIQGRGCRPTPPHRSVAGLEMGWHGHPGFQGPENIAVSPLADLLARSESRHRHRLHQERASRKRGHPGPWKPRSFRKRPGGCPDRGHRHRAKPTAAAVSPGRFSMNPPSFRSRSPCRRGIP